MSQTTTRDDLDPAVLAWLRDGDARLQDPIRSTLIAGGRSNLTYRVEDATGRVLALRRPPLGGILAGAHDVAREWRWISGVHGSDVPVARPVALNADRAVTPYDVYATEFVEGVVLDAPAAAESFGLRARRRVGERTIEVLAHLHALDPDAVDAPSSRSTAGYVERQLRRWTTQISQVEFAEAGLLAEGARLLGADIPPQRTGIVHGDYRPGNIIYGRDGEVLAVLDWELAARGDVLADLGWLLSGWNADAGSITPGVGSVPGFLGPRELTEHYATITGADVSRVDYYVAFANWRLACVAVGVRHRYRSGVMGDDGFAPDALDLEINQLGEATLVGLTEAG